MSQKAGRAESQWVPLLNGRITAAGAPSRARLALWKSWGATDVLTLQRVEEMRAGLPDECEELGLRWHHYPLSGRRLERSEDKKTLAELPFILPLLQGEEPRSLVAHCAAGLHRTGVALYLLMRQAGLSQEESLARIEQARPLTASELIRRTRKSGCLVDVIEGILNATVD